MGKNRKYDNTIYGREKYLEDIKMSKFVFCPRGNGIDTHRIWETLYMGSIPVVKYEEYTHSLFRDLPILFIENWSEISDVFLHNKYEEYNKKNWNLDKLKIDFWKNFILKKYNNNEKFL